VFIRYRVFEKIARQNSLRRISIEDMGDVMTKASGYEDDFILNRIQKEIPKDQIIKEYSDEVKKALARKKI
jgi:fructose-1,6-bisphosphatase/inositol monophosphatase family enzyme